MKTINIYQLTCFVNGWVKRSKTWETLYSFQKIYVGREGLKAAYAEFETQNNKFNYYRTTGNWNRIGDVRGKCELHIPHIHEDGTIAYWGDKILQSINPDNI
jgi:hypothetical protein